MSNQPFKTKTVSSEKKSVVDAKLKPTAEMHVLIGGPYVLDGEEHRYGHTAIRLKTTATDSTYDFGRYGLTTGDFGAEGEGILRVWSDYSQYIAGENALGRKTTSFVYRIFDHQAALVDGFFARLIEAAKRRADLERKRPSLKVYRLAQNYHALGPNCTTLSVDAAKAVFPNYDAGSAAFIKPDDVMTFKERLAMKTVGGGTPGHIFLPANLLKFLTERPAIKEHEVITYGGK